MRVLLLKPSNLSDHIQPSLGLGYLAAQIRNDHDVRIIDCIKEHMPGPQLLPVLEEFKPDVVGTQCYSMDLPKLKPVLETVKAYNPDIKTIVGGAHPTAAPEQTIRYFGRELIDFVFVGEGELGFPIFLEELAKGDDAKFSRAPGLGWMSDGMLVLNPKGEIEDLDALGMPAWDLIMPESYPFSPHGVVVKNFPTAPIMATRGCPYHCTFCSSAGTKLRTRSPELVLEEVKLLHSQHGIKEFHVIDDNFTFDMDYARKFLDQLIAMDLGASWATPNGVRLDRLDDDLLRQMKKAGFYSICVGLESGSDRVRIQIKKGSKKAKIRKDLDRIAKVGGIDVTGFFMLGFPTETIEDVKETIEFAMSLPIQRAAFHSFIPLPGTEIWRQMEASGELDKVDWDKYFFWAGAYVPESMDREDLRRLHREAFRRFYLRPRIIAQNAKFLVRPRVLVHGLRYLWRRVRPEWLANDEDVAVSLPNTAS